LILFAVGQGVISHVEALIQCVTYERFDVIDFPIAIGFLQFATFRQLIALEWVYFSRVIHTDEGNYGEYT